MEVKPKERRYGSTRPAHQRAFFYARIWSRRFGYLSSPITFHISRAALMQMLTSGRKLRARIVYLYY